MTANLPEDFYRVLFQEAPIGLALCLLETGELVNVNQAYADLLGRSVEETLKLSYWQVTPRRYEREEQEQLAYLRENRRYGPYEKEYIHKNGSLIPVRLSGVIVEIQDLESGRAPGVIISLSHGATTWPPSKKSSRTQAKLRRTRPTRPGKKSRKAPTKLQTRLPR